MDALGRPGLIISVHSPTLPPIPLLPLSVSVPERPWGNNYAGPTRPASGEKEKPTPQVREHVLYFTYGAYARALGASRTPHPPIQPRIPIRPLEQTRGGRLPAATATLGEGGIDEAEAARSVHGKQWKATVRGSDLGTHPRTLR